MKPLNKLIDIFSFEDEFDRTPAVVVEDFVSFIKDDERDFLLESL